MRKLIVTYEQCSVVVTPFPFTDKNATKKRPALIISEPDYQQKTGHATMLMITSAKHKRWHGDVEIKDLLAAGLPVPSVIRQKIFTIDLRLIIRQIGQLASEDQWETGNIISTHFGWLLNNNFTTTNYCVHDGD